MSELTRKEVLDALKLTEEDIARIEAASGEPWDHKKQVDALAAQSVAEAEQALRDNQ